MALVQGWIRMNNPELDPQTFRTSVYMIKVKTQISQENWTAI